MSTHVLIVDDIPVNVRLLEAKFSAECYEVITAGSGAEVLEIIQNGLPDIVLLDVMMPEMDGFEVCRRIEANPATAFLPVKLLLDELRLCQETSRQMNILREVENCDEPLHGKRVLFVGEEPSEGDLIAATLDDSSHVDVLSNSSEAMQKALEQSYDMVFVSHSLIGSDPLHLCSLLRSNLATKC